MLLLLSTEVHFSKQEKYLFAEGRPGGAVVGFHDVAENLGHFGWTLMCRFFNTCWIGYSFPSLI
jgi:hypothetical protein